jgi:ribonuclease P protein component
LIVAFCLLNMKKFNSIKKNSDFQKVYRTGRSFANKLLVMYVIKTEREDTRIGISVSKKVGNSVVRHHITRLVRESYRLNKDRVKRIRHRRCSESCSKRIRFQKNRKCISALVRTS